MAEGEGGGQTELVRHSASVSDGLQQAARDLRWLVSEPNLPIDTKILLAAEAANLQKEIRDNVRARLVAAVMDRVASLLTKASKELRDSMEADFLTVLTLLDTKSVEITGVGRISRQERSSTSFDRDAMVQSLLRQGVATGVIERAIAKAESKKTVESTVMRWKK